MQDSEDIINRLTEKVIGAAIEVHKQLGPGLLKNGIQRLIQD
jgi:hypothetical protein